MTDTPDAPHVFAHTVRGGTFLHGGPREGCTLPGCAPTQADGDQARNRIAAARAEADGLAETMRNTDRLTTQQLTAERTEHEQRRTTLATALGCPNNATWDHLTAYARQTQKTIASLEQQIETERCRHEAAERDQAAIDVAAAEQAARAARQGEAEAIRARTAAEQRERDAERGVTNIRNEYEALLACWRQTCEELQRVKDSAGKTAATLRETENQLAASRKDAAKARIRSGLNIMEARRNHDAWRNARKRAAERTAVLRSTRHNFEMKQRHLSEAEATLAAVREITGERPTVVLPWSEIDSRLTAIRAALGDPQPAAEVCCVCGCPDVVYHNHREQPFCCRCAECCEPPVLCAHGCQPAAKANPEADLAALTVPVTPRENQPAGRNHPMWALRDAIEGPPLQHYEATGLIKAYYDAITSAPPASPAERPLAITVQAELTPEQVRKVVKRAARMANLGRELGRR